MCLFSCLSSETITNIFFVLDRHVEEVCSTWRIYIVSRLSVFLIKSDYIYSIAVSNAMSSHNPEQRYFAEPLMLEKIDNLFTCGVGELVSLPQIVVVGDQSSGKSSVLEGLIKKPLPRDRGLCTQFATQIIFRRASREQVVISIIPDQQASPEVGHLQCLDSRDGDEEAVVEVGEHKHELRERCHRPRLPIHHFGSYCYLRPQQCSRCIDQ
jgi:hypothetical protein